MVIAAAFSMAYSLTTIREITRRRKELDEAKLSKMKEDLAKLKERRDKLRGKTPETKTTSNASHRQATKVDEPVKVDLGNGGRITIADFLSYSRITRRRR